MLTEPAVGSDRAGAETQLCLRPESWLINGYVTWTLEKSETSLLFPTNNSLQLSCLCDFAFLSRGHLEKASYWL